ncbi:MAG: L-serine ammonia-lyase, iron-sulfur-dependent, subunit alpha [Spirochaetaceae bacterium]|jgi:L-cysteine desulfidase|nr:L-serine ammonia-lyase, iron-sulfur-dependent, subunit alpha [Spirochaetaceae bacterium]
MGNNDDFLLDQIKKSIQIATGCTEPVAIALNAAVARKNTPGNITGAAISMDEGLLKNALHVGIPGVQGRGIELCAALGFVAGNPDDGMDIFSHIAPSDEETARLLVPLITVSIKKDCTDLYIETTLTTDQGCTRVITYKNHDNIASVEHPPFSDFVQEENPDAARMRTFSLEDLREFADRVPIDKIRFLKDGVDVNRRIAAKGMEMGFGRSLSRLSKYTLWGDSLLPYVQELTGAASFARMSGVQMPVMIATGSGNQGITLFLTVAAAADKIKVGEEKLLRGLALALCVNLLAKSYLGTLAPLCACGVASGLGAAVGIVYLQDGTTAQMAGTVRSMIGGLTGMICDGAKEGCANKVAISATYAALSAMTAVSDFSISGDNGILSEDIRNVFENLEYLAKEGMKNTNEAILHIMGSGKN